MAGTPHRSRTPVANVNVAAASTVTKRVSVAAKAKGTTAATGGAIETSAVAAEGAVAAPHWMGLREKFDGCLSKLL